jgi:hypothetical protein
MCMNRYGDSMNLNKNAHLEVSCQVPPDTQVSYFPEYKAHPRRQNWFTHQLYRISYTYSEWLSMYEIIFRNILMVLSAYHRIK